MLVGGTKRIAFKDETIFHPWMKVTLILDNFSRAYS
jgi:hypothetical protein